MSDRSLRLLTLPPQSVQGGKRGAVLLRERPASPPDAPSDKKPGDEQSGGTQDDNPFAPPPEGTPDRPWRPRRPADGENGDGSGGAGSPWGSQWSDRQPGRSPGGFGERPGGPPPSPEGQGGNNNQGSGMRWDPTDPAQRRARYALLCGMWAFFFALFSWPYVALLLGALALYWGVSALRATKAGASEHAGDPGGRPQATAAVTGLVTASLAIALVAASFTAQMVYSDYYTCTNDALTNQAKQSCSQLLPKELRGLLGTNG
ncbi:hypothetical protein GCM10022403_055980 [Streptomyces coacervatus]|uniref:Integral membrane protein n=1 Tax=Streptomyces coacervatus TaxID=647381 RepID=A0ABP7ICT6_9ACTN|nr:hypothetical protein [Streptomyces coacervatus]MDF2269038.1 hypothetical protein [Streptomyces coacervatus]